MRVATAFLALLLGIVPAAAEDFSGFYAGVNAGWAFERGRDGTAPVPPWSAREAEGLPPSVSRIEERRPPPKSASGRVR